MSDLEMAQAVRRRAKRMQFVFTSLACGGVALGSGAGLWPGWVGAILVWVAIGVGVAGFAWVTGPTWPSGRDRIIDEARRMPGMPYDRPRGSAR